MEQAQHEETRASAGAQADEIRNVVRSVIEEYLDLQKRASEPAYKAELEEERKRREQLERRLNELIEENKRSRQMAEESDRHAQIRSELQRLGVSKIDLAFKIVKDDIVRAPDGSLVAKTPEGEKNFREYLSSFVHENPEFLPARIAGGSGVVSPPKTASGVGVIDLEKIRPGMSREELQRIREQISQVALQSLKGE
ncbi:MAG: hypothetical protein NZR01_05025 [Bryobacteraceae bacterium]|nr:hypothetical protein [Bryobacteraceae bacterium]